MFLSGGGTRCLKATTASQNTHFCGTSQPRADGWSRFYERGRQIILVKP
jgi:hypothetical protein